MTAGHRLARGVRTVGLSGASTAGIGAAGVPASTRAAYPPAPHTAPAKGWPPAAPVAAGRIAVGVVLDAQSVEYAIEHLRQAGAAWPWRPTALFAFTGVVASRVGLPPAATGGSRR